MVFMKGKYFTLKKLSNLCVCVCVFSQSVVSDSLQPYGL